MKLYKITLRDSFTDRQSVEWYSVKRQAEHREREFRRMTALPFVEIEEIDVPTRKFGLLKILRTHAV